MQTNDIYLSELLKLELFDHSTVCKLMTDVLIELLVIHGNIWYQLTLYKRMSNDKLNNQC